VNLPSPVHKAASFWVDLAERTFLTFIQAFVGALTVGTGANAASSPHPFLNLPWELAAEIGGVAAVVCLLTGLGSMPFGDAKSASFLPPPEHINTFFAERKK
jgi:hypothetical protein